MRHFTILKYFKLLVINFSLLVTSNAALAQAGAGSHTDYDLNKLALPSETQGLKKATGSIYYSPSIKGKVLIPVHFWGYFQRPGLHFVPVESSLLEGVSYAGGPNLQGKIDNVKLMRKNDKGNFENTYFNLEKGGGNEAALKELRPGDMIFVEKDYWQENRAYYTSLVAVFATVLSSILLYRQVRKN